MRVNFKDYGSLDFDKYLDLKSKDERQGLGCLVLILSTAKSIRDLFSGLHVTIVLLRIFETSGKMR